MPTTFRCSTGSASRSCISRLRARAFSRLGTERCARRRRQTPDVTQPVLTNQLRELEADGLIEPKVYPQVPPKVEYSILALGRTLEPILLALKNVGGRERRALRQGVRRLTWRRSATRAIRLRGDTALRIIEHGVDKFGASNNPTVGPRRDTSRKRPLTGQDGHFAQ